MDLCTGTGALLLGAKALVGVFAVCELHKDGTTAQSSGLPPVCACFGHI